MVHTSINVSDHKIRHLKYVVEYAVDVVDDVGDDSVYYYYYDDHEPEHEDDFWLLEKV